MAVNSLVLSDSQLLTSAQEIASQQGGFLNSAAVQYIIQESLPEEKAVLPLELSSPDYQIVLEKVFEEFAEGQSPVKELILPVNLENGDLAAIQLRKDANNKPQVIYIDPTGLDIAPDRFDDSFAKGNALKYSTLPSYIAQAVENGLKMSRQDIVITTNKVRSSFYQDGVRYVDAKTDDSATFISHITGEIANGRYDVEVDESGKGTIVTKSPNGQSVSIDSLKLNTENLRQGQLEKLKQAFHEQFPDRAAEIDEIKIEKSEVAKPNKSKTRKTEETSEENIPAQSKANPWSFPSLLRKAATILAFANLPGAAATTDVREQGLRRTSDQSGVGDLTFSDILPQNTTHELKSDSIVKDSGREIIHTQNFPAGPGPSVAPTAAPTAPTGQPTRQPSTQPTKQPSTQPTRQPSTQPTGQPSTQTSNQPTRSPTTEGQNSDDGLTEVQNKKRFIETIIYAAGGTALGITTEALALTLTQGSFGGMLYRLWEDGVLAGTLGTAAFPTITTATGAIIGSTQVKQDSPKSNDIKVEIPQNITSHNVTLHNVTLHNVTSHNVTSHVNVSSHALPIQSSVNLGLNKTATDEEIGNITPDGIHTRVDDDSNKYHKTKVSPDATRSDNPTYVAEGAFNGFVGGSAFLAGIVVTSLIATCCCGKDRGNQVRPSATPVPNNNGVTGIFAGATNSGNRYASV